MKKKLLVFGLFQLMFSNSEQVQLVYRHLGVQLVQKHFAVPLAQMQAGVWNSIKKHTQSKLIQIINDIARLKNFAFYSLNVE